MSSTKKELKLALLGSSGKMGQKLQELIATPEWKDKFRVTTPIHADTPRNEPTGDFDVMIDFSAAPSTLSWLDFSSEHKKPYLICTTGFSTEEFSTLKSKLKNQAWAFIPNTSLGVFALISSLVSLVKFFNDIEKIEIHEVHHVHKKDQPSGTALLIQAAIVSALGSRKIPIEVKSAREGEVIGIHTVLFQRKFDRLILTHEAQDRKLFAEGALALAEKLATKPPRAEPYTFNELL